MQRSFYWSGLEAGFKLTRAGLVKGLRIKRVLGGQDRLHQLALVQPGSKPSEPGAQDCQETLPANVCVMRCHLVSKPFVAERHLYSREGLGRLKKIDWEHTRNTGIIVLSIAHPLCTELDMGAFMSIMKSTSCTILTNFYPYWYLHRQRMQ